MFGSWGGGWTVEAIGWLLAGEKTIAAATDPRLTRSSAIAGGTV